MPKPRPIQRKTIRERRVERDKTRQRKAVVRETRKADRTERSAAQRVTGWGGLTLKQERKRAAQKDRAKRIAAGEQVRAQPVNVVYRSQRPPTSNPMEKPNSNPMVKKPEPSLPDSSAPITPTTAAQVLANLYREGSPRSASASISSTLFTPEELATADLWARRLIGDFICQRQGQRSLYVLDESDLLNSVHVSGKLLRDCTVEDLAISALAHHLAVDHMVAMEVEAA